MTSSSHKQGSLELTNLGAKSDIESIHLNNSSVKSVKEAFVNELAADLSKVVDEFSLDDKVIKEVVKALPEALRTFSLSLGQASSTQTQRDVMAYIHQYRWEIATALKQLLIGQGAGHPSRQTGGAKSLDEVIRLSGQKNGTNQASQNTARHCRNARVQNLDAPDSPDRHYECSEHSQSSASVKCRTELGDEMGPPSGFPQVQSYLALIHKSPTYPWLLDSIRRECVLAAPERQLKCHIRDYVQEALPQSSRMNRKYPTATFDVLFKVYWDPVGFLEEQGYEETSGEAFGRIITLTGCNSTVQALTIQDYMQQTWPSTGMQILNLVKALVCGRGALYVNLVDGTHICCSRRSFSGDQTLHQMYFEVDGTGPVVAEIGEQVSWMASALQTCSKEGTINYSKPRIRLIDIPRPYDYQRPSTQYFFEVLVDMHGRPQSTEVVNGQCWHRLTTSPVIVEGFPTRRRPEHVPEGLDIPLDMLAKLVDTTRVSTFDGKTLLKGYSAMAIVTRYTQNTVIWHFVDENDGHISHLRSEEWAGLSLSVDDLKAARHIVGWCPEMKLFAGEYDASYNIKNTGLPLSIRGNGLLNNVTLSTGRIIADGTGPILDHRTRAQRTSFVRNIEWIFEKYVVLWDVSERRGWLVNGASALLHLVRASITEDRADRIFKSVCLASEKQSHDAMRPYQWDSACEMLLHPINRKFKINPQDNNPIYFQDRVEEYFTLLEQAIDYQLRATSREDAATKQPRSLLDGWDFRDLILEKDRIHSRQTVLAHEGRLWVDLTRSIHAVTLFGRGFGDILLPAEGGCAAWKTLPTGRWYLAATAPDLSNIAEAYGGPYSNPVKLTHNLCLCPLEADNSPTDGEQDPQPLEYIVGLLPISMQTEPRRSTGTINWKVGAIVFGFSSNNPWYWGDYGNPTRDPSSESTVQLGVELSHPLLDDSDTKHIGPLHPSSERSRLREREVERAFLDWLGWRNVIPVPPQLPEGARPPPVPVWKRSLLAKHYSVGIICALNLELMAVRALFDEFFEMVPLVYGDPNHYALGRIAEHNVVGACLPHGSYGTSSAAECLSKLKRSFRKLKFCLLLDIGAGVPSAQNDIRLGDVVIGTPRGEHPGVVPYDMTKSMESGALQLSGHLPPPPTDLKSVISQLEADPSLSATPLAEHLRQLEIKKIQYQRPDLVNDRLFPASYPHQAADDQAACDHCDPGQEVRRPPRSFVEPRIHYGLIASGNQVIRSAETRDRLAQGHNILCFSVEGPGILDSFPCLVIRGICNYADSHQNKLWQNYAAATAAAYAKMLLARVPGTDGPKPETGKRKRRRASPGSGPGPKTTAARRGSSSKQQPESCTTT
ncbi:Pfs domain protein [Aspergillus homomorphus CBS 101889]|uniref:Nucleoside phosphorylase domain-containing protein n=1 Tax=Aspergillus homomorphus (strain CBS 101889) TaxID=1450537 RepID=A0A395HNA1_ASPHC|nr:hypothetical protein BO97DRAFT_353386 [Aspergillus homomorphus CBS 101889]RAL08755.1 hypothetical protein BO97DRAFT_353386 [Aspergillus homomorphus CBS 101889]